MPEHRSRKLSGRQRQLAQRPGLAEVGGGRDSRPVFLQGF